MALLPFARGHPDADNFSITGGRIKGVGITRRLPSRESLNSYRFLLWQGSTARRTGVYTAVNEDSSAELTTPE
jgi:hypothetical protein